MEPMRIILTTNTDRAILVSEQDYEAVARFRWFEKQSAATTYPARSIRRGQKVQTQRLHDLIVELANMVCPKGSEPHHRDHDSFNNTRSNLVVLPKREHCSLHRRSA